MRYNDAYRRPSRTRNWVSLVLSFFLALALVAEAALLIVHVGVFSEGGFLSVLDETYYQLVRTYVDDQCYYYTIPTGIKPEVARDLFTVEDVQYDVRQHILGTFAGSEYEPDMSAAEELLTERVNSFFTESGVKLSAETDQICSTYVSEIMDIYRDVVKMPGLGTIANIRNSYMKYSLIGSVVVGLAIIILTVTIQRLHHFPHRAMRYLAYATGGAALMCFVVPFAIYQSGAYLGLNFTPQYFYHFGTSLVAHVLKLCMFAGLGLLVVTVVLILVIASLRGRSASHGGHHRH